MAISILDHLIEKLEHIGDGAPWYGKSFTVALQSITNDEALYKKGLPYSIAELLAHIIQWKCFVIEKLIGNDDFDIDDVNIKDWPEILSLTQDEWTTLRQKYFLSHAKLLQVLYQIDESVLLQAVPGRSYNFAFMINGGAEHDIYHLGQIQLIYKTIQINYSK